MEAVMLRILGGAAQDFYGKPTFMAVKLCVFA